MSVDWTEFEPNWNDPSWSLPRLISLAEKLASDVDLDQCFVPNFFEDLENAHDKEETAKLAAAGSILIDLARQGWRMAVDGSVILISPPSSTLDATAEKARVQAQEKIKRDEQLATPSVSRFLRKMESTRLHNGAFISIFSLMRDGEDLAKSLRHSRDNVTLADDFKDIIQPYVQVIASDKERCGITGLLVSEIWRYFRFTWTNQATSVPGRGIRFLIRDRGAPCHPIIGIGAIGSSIIALRDRDRLIGWDPDEFLARLQPMLLSNILSWISSSIEKVLDGIYVDDLIQEGLIKKEDFNNPSAESIRLMIEKAAESRQMHYNHVPDRQLKAPVTAEESGQDAYWASQAKTPLFRSKRLSQLAIIFRVIRAFQSVTNDDPEEDASSMMENREMRWALSALIRLEKARKIGISMSDIMVCGAVPPYGALVGGKLVSALAVSPEIISVYKHRYSQSPSLIASKMAGRRIVRNPELVVFGTTSLYGTTSSQYNRIKIPCELLGGSQGEYIQYQKVGHTKTFGTSHFSERTVAALVTLSRQSAGGLRVNSIFGEGVSPKFRKVREGLNRLGVPADVLLHHERKRIVYMVPVIRNFSDYLTGFADAPDYLVPINDSTTKSNKIVQWWSNRWGIPRALQDKNLHEIESHRTTYPMRHGARVATPREQSGQQALFE